MTITRRDAATDTTIASLVSLGRALLALGYAFVTVTPETHRRVDARARERGESRARSLRDVFGWSRPFEPTLLPEDVLDLAQRSNVLIAEQGEEGRALLRSTVRFSSLDGRLFVHSSYPTISASSVFFGPDTYRYCDLLLRELPPNSRRVVDIGCGSGAGGIVLGSRRDSLEVVLTDVNTTALVFAEANARLAGGDDVAARVTTIESDVLANVDGAFDLVIANPPYMVDAGARTYREGGGSLGEALAVRIAREAFERLRAHGGGRLILYTGAAIVDGRDTFAHAVRPLLEERGIAFRYQEIDPDVFGEEIEQNDVYARVERIAAVALVADVAT